ncbi:NAD(P)H-hydrate dehydratase [Caldilinea sp.]|uniref:NAD(P)H-hydrate dehydratase n=1 Tax=Caldilinea sp. TaxID=2293560 RepID=UPI0021DC1227|nr:NAD(P)H-hydrate dehydratase [Caldilinea sp.]GIV67368.1 MAG: bifunctional ADP-dependent (S)-NAD(P)H-hydrate dehydratase/NAD(P)H-hydrate epimerase [Caldilinea sp.]
MMQEKTLEILIPAKQRIVTVAEMQALERAADAGGHSYAAMMELAGRAVAEAILERYGRVSCLVLAGPGNNGGDGLVCARHLHEAGAMVRVYLWKRATDPERDYEGHFARLQALGVPAAHADADPAFETLRAWLDCSVVVDALLGTGANRPIQGQLADLLDEVRRARSLRQPAFRVVAVDCVSGMNCDTGALDPHSLPADLTVTFACAKAGHYLFPAAEAGGELIVADIGIDPALMQGVRTFALDETTIRSWLPARPANSHKGAFGKVMLVVGSEAYPGAAYLASAAAGRAGAGLVTVASIRAVCSLTAAKLPEPTYVLLPEAMGANGAVIAGEASGTVHEAIQGYRALVAGCGLGNAPATRQFMANLLDPSLPAAVFDADGLNCLAAHDGWWRSLPARTVLTPHPAEMARLCHLSVAQVLADRWVLARQKAAEWGCTVLLKGPYTVVAEPSGWLAVLPVATSALATAGSGDVLAGIVGGLLAQGLDAFAAACVGAWLHGAAGLACAASIGEAGVVASDLLPHLPRLQKRLRGEDAGSSLSGDAP